MPDYGVPINLQFMSYAANRNPQYNQLSKMFGALRQRSATDIDIAAEERGQNLQIFERGLAEQTRSSRAQEEISRSRNQNQITMLMEQLGLQREELTFQRESYSKDFALERERFAEFQEASDFEQQLQQQQFAEFKETSDLTQQRMTQEIANLTAYYKELMPQYAELFNTDLGSAPTSSRSPISDPRRGTGYDIKSGESIF